MSNLSVTPGYNTIEEEFEASLRRAFVDGKADFIVIYDRRRKFLLESALYGEAQGWLSQGEGILQMDEQSSEARFRLTPAGKEHFGLI